MKFFVLSDKPDVYLGMRLAGMDGAVVEDRNEALDRIREIVAAKEVGILLITGELMDRCEPELTAIRQEGKDTLGKTLGIDGKIQAIMALGIPAFKYPKYTDRKEIVKNYIE